MTRTKKRHSQPRRKPAPAVSESQQVIELARRVVDGVFASLMTDSEALNPDMDQPDLEAFAESFEQIVNLLEAEHVAHHGEIEQDTFSWAHVTFGIQAGYMVGTQVGLRLRQPGGGQ